MTTYNEGGDLCPSVSRALGDAATSSQVAVRALTGQIAPPQQTTAHSPQEVPKAIEIAVDTEYEGPHTLLIQTACRLQDNTVAVQLYRSPLVPDLPATFCVNEYLSLTPTEYGRFCPGIALRPTITMSPHLSPVIHVVDLLQLQGVSALSASAGRDLVRTFDESWCRPNNVTEKSRSGRWKVPPVDVTLIMHFQPADFLRCVGRYGWQQAGLGDPDHSRHVRIEDRRTLRLIAEGESRFQSFLWGYLLLPDGRLYEVRVKFVDTMSPFGRMSLDDLSKIFLGFGKSDVLTAEQKANMRGMFASRTSDAFGYAIVDAANTLLVWQQMQVQHEKIYTDFGFCGEEIPDMRATLGGGVADFLTTATLKYSAGSELLAKKPDISKLMGRGSIRSLDEAKASRYGAQTAGVHGGLFFSRSSTRLWHEVLGQLRDVDLESCYARILGRLNVYWGTPVVFEPGNCRRTLREAVEFARKHAADDAWMIRVTGDIKKTPNALISSTDDAITSENFRQRRRRSQTKAKTSERSARLYSQRIEAGIVVHATWLMIEAMPDEARREYENLTADTIILYPERLVAASGCEYDELVEAVGASDLPWQCDLDLDGFSLVETHSIDAEYVSLRFPISHYATRFAELRDRAIRERGKGSRDECVMKLRANTLYGVLASEYLITNNFVAANQVTATARATAFALMMSLNGIQVITDGVTYRTDQIPAGTFADACARHADYPVRRAEEDGGLAFIDASEIPMNDERFTLWYRDHAKRFFGVQGQFYDDLFDIHSLRHKRGASSGQTSFDALACDGAGTDVILLELSVICRWTPGVPSVISTMATRELGERSMSCHSCRSGVLDEHWLSRTRPAPDISVCFR